MIVYTGKTDIKEKINSVIDEMLKDENCIYREKENWKQEEIWKTK